MSITDLETRVARLEAELQQTRKSQEAVPEGVSWTDYVFGAFADDLTFEEAMRLGREYREAQRLPEDAQP